MGSPSDHTDNPTDPPDDPVTNGTNQNHPTADPTDPTDNPADNPTTDGNNGIVIIYIHILHYLYIEPVVEAIYS